MVNVQKTEGNGPAVVAVERLSNCSGLPQVLAHSPGQCRPEVLGRQERVESVFECNSRGS